MDHLVWKIRDSKGLEGTFLRESLRKACGVRARSTQGRAFGIEVHLLPRRPFFVMDLDDMRVNLHIAQGKIPHNPTKYWGI